MLVIKDLFENIEHNNIRRGLRKNKSKSNIEFIRYTDYIKSKPFYILEINKSFVEAPNIQKLLTGFQGNVVVNENIDAGFIRKYLFDETDYVIRALLSSFLRVISYEAGVKSVYIRLISNNNRGEADRSNAIIFDEIYPIIKSVRDVNIVLKSEAQLQLLREKCFRRYGTIINSRECENVLMYDAYLDFENVDCDGKCEMYLKGRSCILYPDSSYFEVDDDIRKLLAYGVNKKVACAICNSKKT